MARAHRAHVGGHAHYGLRHASRPRGRSSRRGGRGRRWPWLHHGGSGGGAIPSPLVTWAQGCLAQLIGPQVPQDGLMGPGTQQAIQQFQMQQQLPPTGILDSNTISALQAACSGQQTDGQQAAQDVGPPPSQAPAPQAPAPQAPPPQAPPRKPRAPPSQEIGESEFDVTPGARQPQYLRFINLDKFIWNKASLTPEIRQKIELLAKHVSLSWTTMHPIAYITLIGHTDITGPEKYNRDLGNWRAQAVKRALEDLLQDDILKRRVAIIIEPSPGASAPTADNRTAEGMALNRRVEVYVAPPEPPPQLPPVIDWTIKDPNPPPPPVFRYDKNPPGLPRGRSFKEWLDNEMEKRGVPKFLRTRIWDAIFNQSWGPLSLLLDQAHVTGAAKDAIIDAARGAGEARP
jgi:outer membrane protein OmpA-like peptidoglycan-associated protein